MSPRKSDDVKSHKREMKDDNKSVTMGDENEKRNSKGKITMQFTNILNSHILRFSYDSLFIKGQKLS